MTAFRAPPLIAATALVACLMASPAAAQTFHRNISFCNRTTGDVGVALGFDRAGTSQITSKGWWIVRGCTCRSLTSADLRATEIFFLVTRGGGTVNVLGDARAPMCADPRNRFEFLGQNANPGACAAGGGQWTNFKFKDTGTQENFRLNFRIPGQCNLMGDT
jgi:uncharacterized membrane protein